MQAIREWAKAAEACKDAALALDAAQEMERAHAWRPISEAPKDGKCVDVWCSYFRNGNYHQGDRKSDAFFDGEQWLDSDGEPIEWRDDIGQAAKVTHWMPLPEPPALGLAGWKEGT